MIVAVVLILTVGGVIILRPISKRVSELLELYARDKDRTEVHELRRMRELLESMDARMRLVEERQDFTDKLLERPAVREPARLPSERSGG
jgi:hypothetical protein